MPTKPVHTAPTSIRKPTRARAPWATPTSWNGAREQYHTIKTNDDVLAAGDHLAPVTESRSAIVWRLERDMPHEARTMEIESTGIGNAPLGPCIALNAKRRFEDPDDPT